MILFLYRFLAAPIIWIGFIFLSLFNRKIRKMLKQRVFRSDLPSFSTQPIWIHASSGEFEYAKSVIRELKLHQPLTPIVVTYFSSTYAQAAHAFPGVDFACPLPLDLPGPMSSFIRKLKPRRLLVARTDLWPEMLYQTRRHKMPVTIFSYTQKAVGSIAGRWFRRWLLNQVNFIACVSESDKAELRHLQVRSQCQVIGDTRFDQVAYRLKHPKDLPEVLKPKGLKLVAGSTWIEDETVLIAALQSDLQAQHIKLILVPHEPTDNHIAKICKKLISLNLTFALYSDLKAWEDEHVLIVDQVGVLAELYQWADIAFVGGSFKGSVHSVMEPLGVGCPVLVGPHYKNNREAIEFNSLRAGPMVAVTEVHNQNDIRAFIEKYLNTSTQIRTTIPDAITSHFRQRQGATKKLLAALDKHFT